MMNIVGRGTIYRALTVLYRHCEEGIAVPAKAGKQSRSNKYVIARSVSDRSNPDQSVVIARRA